MMLDAIGDHVFGVCCGLCRNGSKFNQMRNTKIHKLNRNILNTSNIVYPVLGMYVVFLGGGENSSRLSPKNEMHHLLLIFQICMEYFGLFGRKIEYFFD